MAVLIGIIISIMKDLIKIIFEKSQTDDKTSYTSQLFQQGLEKIVKKYGEESFEVAIAALKEDDDRLISEVVDNIYHLLCILVKREITLEQIENEIIIRLNTKKEDPDQSYS